MSEPFYVRQTAETMTGEERHRWIEGACSEAREAGAKHDRISISRELVPDKTLVLVEAWHERPEDEGEQRWALTAEKNP